MQLSSDDSLKGIVIIPACNNTNQLVNVLAGFAQIKVDEICVVVDRANTNELNRIKATTAKIETPVHIITHVERKGIGYAIRSGINYALKENYDIAIIMAGNGKDQPKEINRLLKPILTQGYDYIQGSRFLPGGKPVRNPFLRGLFSRLFPYIWTLFTKTRCTDVTNGFRAYRLDMFRNCQINIWQSWLDGYQLEYYIHYKALTLGYKTKEVPVSKIYPFRHKGGYSNISPLRDWWTIIAPLIYLKIGAKK